MRTVLDILFEAEAQTVVFDAPEGRPTDVVSVTAHRWNAGDGTIEDAIEDFDVETDPDTETAAAAGQGELDPREVRLSDTTGCATERSYLLVGEHGLREVVEVLELDDLGTLGGTVTTRHPLHNHYEVGASFVSTRIVAMLRDDWTSDESKLITAPGPNPMYRVRWVYKIDEQTFVADTYFNLVRYGARHGVTAHSVDNLAPGWLHSLPPDHFRNQGRSLIDDAYRAVKLDLHGVDFDDATIAEAEVVDELTRYKVIELSEWAKIIAGGGDLERHKLAEDKYTRRLDSLLRVVARVPVRDDSGAAQPPPTPGSLTVR